MGFQVHITRHYVTEDTVPITLEEWLTLVRTQEDLSIIDDDEVIFAIDHYLSHSQDWGMIAASPTDQTTMQRVIELAESLNAMVIDDQGQQRFMPDGRIIPDGESPDGNNDVDQYWNTDQYWQGPPERPPLTRLERLCNW